MTMAVVHGTMIVAQMVSLPMRSDGGGKAGRLQGKVVSPPMEQPEVHRQVALLSMLAAGHTSVADAAPASATSSSRRMGAMVRTGAGVWRRRGPGRAQRPRAETVPSRLPRQRTTDPRALYDPAKKEAALSPDMRRGRSRAQAAMPQRCVGDVLTRQLGGQ